MVEPVDDSSHRAEPVSPFGALIGDFAAQAQRRSLDAILFAFEHLLRQQQWARDRLRSHAGATIRLGVDAAPIAGLPAPQWRLTIDDEGFLRTADPSAEPAVTLLLRPSVDALFAALRDGAEGISRHLRIDGDVMLAATMGELARHLRWEAEEDLSRVVGDVAAHRIARVARQGVGQVRELGTRAESAATRFLAGDQQVLATRPLLLWLRESASALSQRADALELRVDRLRKSR